MLKNHKLVNKKLKDFLKNYNGILEFDSNIDFENFNGISTDSRKIQKGDIFIGLNGENYKGHNFVHDAINLGAEICILDKKYNLPNQIVVKSTLDFIQSFASYILKTNKKLKRFGITGTNGKTTTKEMLNNILNQKFNVLATKGNLNNQIGLPLTIFNLTNSTEIIILEMGTNSKGEIERLAEIARPNFATITNIGKGHIEGLKNKENVFKEKSNIIKYFNPESNFSFNLDDEYIKNLYSKINCDKISYSIMNDADITAKDISEDFSSFNLLFKRKKYPIKLRDPGINNIYNSLCSCGLALKANLEIELIIKGINSFEGMVNRFKITNLKNGNVIINDTYNANPESMIRAIEMTNKIFFNKKKIAILGSMLELGDSSNYEHQQISKNIKINKFDELYSYGNNSKDYSKNLDSNIKFAELSEHDDIKEYIDLNSITNTVILVKGSRGMRMEKIFISLGL